ncbi:hypothetical protein IKP85_06665 [bacterium]|nr:hypothetical protein [bacterium]
MDDRDKLFDLITAYGKYEDALDAIKKYNRADTVNMSENEMNKFRHIAGSALLSDIFTPKVVTALGNLKESKDMLVGRGLDDTLYDYGNNQRGIEIGNKFRGVNPQSLFDYIFKTEIEPYRTKK